MGGDGGVSWKLTTRECNYSSPICDHDRCRGACSEFNNIAKNPDLDLYPEDLRSAIDEVNSWVYPTINNGVYRSGFATTQKAYETAFG